MIQKAKIWNNNINHKQTAKHLYRKYNIVTLRILGNCVSSRWHITTRLYLNDTELASAMEIHTVQQPAGKHNWINCSGNEMNTKLYRDVELNEWHKNVGTNCVTLKYIGP